MSRKDYYNLTQMKERGWTAAMVKKLVTIQPTEFKGLYSRQPQKCYPKAYVEDLEATQEFEELKKLAAARHDRMKAIADRKRKENISRFRSRILGVKVPVISGDELRKRTIRSKRNWYRYQADLRCEIEEGIDEANLPKAVLDRWEVNFIRHELTRYDSILDQIRGLVGTGDIYIILRNEVLDRIAAAYPGLAGECSRQKTV
jgi:hypothetical protein